MNDPSPAALPAHLRRGMADATARLGIDPFTGTNPFEAPVVRKHAPDDDLRNLPTLIDDPDGELAACACRCGCGGYSSTMLAARVRGHASSRLVRCDTCLAKKGPHLPGKPVAGGTRFTRDGIMAEDLRRTDFEIEADREAARELRRAQHAKDQKTWFDGLDSKWRDARLENLRDTDPTMTGSVSKVREVITDRLRRLEHAVDTGHDPSEHKGKGLLLTGYPGSGKTWVAYMFLNEAIRKGTLRPGNIVYGTEADLLVPLSVGSLSERTAAMRAMKRDRNKVLFIDDVGQGSGLFFDEASRLSIYNELFDFYYRDGERFVIITTNLLVKPPKMRQNPSDGSAPASSPLENYLGAAAFSRLYDNIAGGTPGVGYIAFPNRDVRGLLNSEAEQAWLDAAQAWDDAV